MTEAVLQIPTPTLHQRHLPSTASGIPLVMLHGWGADSSIFAEFAQSLAQQRPVILVDLPGFGGSQQWLQVGLDELLEILASQLPPQCHMLGWSLGGMVATAFCARFPERVGKLATLASNARFVASSEWPKAMEASTFQQFCQFFEQSPQACLKQFIGLESQGDSQQRQLLKTLRPFAQVDTNSNWQQTLALLGQLDNRDALAALSIPGLHLFGENDALVPVTAVADIDALNSGQQVMVIEGAGHAMHLSVPQRVIEAVEQFLSDSRLSKQRVADSFSRAASSYDAAADLQRKVADSVAALVPENTAPQSTLDVGCGTGYLYARVRERFPHTQLTALDLAPGMLEYAQSHRPVADRWLCGDAEALPLPDNSVDLVVSSLTYQWCEHPQRWGAELQRVLKPGGVAVLSTFGPGTLGELQKAWQAVDDQVHVNRFVPLERLQQQLQAAGLQCQLTTETLCPRYDDLKSLMRDLKAIGAHNVNQGRPSALTGRQRMRALVDAYEQFRDSQGRLPATYEVVYGVVRREM
ncbi:malonyl-ACP O-methyltransferase BioC [Porticoccus sp. W117]|uniref:malonyl-ACP O-methyltransferase BioC n=1 Tax=Porticoccus sp. W117 TaxID=3054777 RepID=UPI0025946899|nr:malonyl-ACP O-methyltransferase BioC [Porticoccus sp. W117]MDM3870712.1 malonyl-ACP O-methyltransferase BioC [Porticoccus sp. W117]